MSFKPRLSGSLLRPFLQEPEQRRVQVEVFLYFQITDKLVVNQGHSDESIPVRQFGTVDELFQVGHQADDVVGMLRWRIHGSLPMLSYPRDIPLERTERLFWNTLFELGKDPRAKNEVKAAVVISAHWCTEGTWVNVSPRHEQIYDYYGFPDESYSAKYSAPGAWPMLMHLFPEGEVPVFQLSLSYHSPPQYHWDLGRQLAPLRDKGVLIIGSGSLIRNLGLAGPLRAQG